MADTFYDEMADFYHLLFEDWEAGMQRQGRQIDHIIRTHWTGSVRTIADVSCGIGTQSLPLAKRGYQVSGSDLSHQAIKRARAEAAQRDLDIPFSVADMRQLDTHYTQRFDLVLSADNALPHLLSDDEILTALKAFYRLLKPGGGCLITMRDYDQEAHEGVVVKPHGVRESAGKRYLIFQTWDFEADQYDLTMYVVEDDGGILGQTHIMRSRYYAVSPNTVLELMRQAGFSHVHRLDDHFYQPVLLGTRPPAT